MDPSVLAWLLEADVAVAFQARRDLLDDADPGLQARIGQEGTGAALLAAQAPDGRWGRGFYQPKWTSTHYTLLELKELALPDDHPVAVAAVGTVLREEKGEDGGVNPAGSVRVSDACINGMVLGYAAYFRADEGALRSVVDFLLGQRMDDGGFNCQRNRKGAQHSSVHSTVCVLEGITDYERRGYGHRLPELLAARATSAEFLLRHRLYRSERTGEPIHDELTRLHHPTRWHHDVLRGLDALAAAGLPHDPRMDDGLDLLLDRRRPDGRWAANRGYPGETHVAYPRAGQPSPWVTLRALRVLRAYPRSGEEGLAVPDDDQ